MEKRSAASKWIQAVRAMFFPATLVPLAVGAAAAVNHGGDVMWTLMPLIVAASLSMHAGTNLINDYFDYKNGIDTKDTLGGSRVLPEGILSTRQVFIGGIISFALSCTIGLVFIYYRGMAIFILGFTGLIGGFFYTARPVGYKYFALGDLLVFFLMGPLMVVGTFFVLTGSYDNTILIMSIPVGCLVTAILHANNMRDVVDDRTARVQTMVQLLGPRGARLEYYMLVAGAYIAVLGMILAKILSPWSFIIFITLPIAVRNLNCAKSYDISHTRKVATLDVQTAQLHLAFGTVFSLSILLGILL